MCVCVWWRCTGAAGARARARMYTCTCVCHVFVCARACVVTRIGMAGGAGHTRPAYLCVRVRVCLHSALGARYCRIYLAGRARRASRACKDGSVSELLDRRTRTAGQTDWLIPTCMCANPGWLKPLQLLLQ